MLKITVASYTFSKIVERRFAQSSLSVISSSCIPRSNIPATGSHMILQERCGKVTGSHRKAPEIAGSGSSIPTGNLLDFFPVDSDQFPVLSSRNRSEIIGKNPKIFRLEYCFHVPVTSGAFLPEPARIFRPGYYESQIHLPSEEPC